MFQGDDLILISNYQRDVILDTVGRFFPALPDRTHVIYNGLDFDSFQPSETSTIRQQISNVDPDQHAVVLFPHRPEAAKGILDAIETANLLVRDYGVTNLRVLVPQWIDVGLSADVRAFYEDLLGQIRSYDLEENFVFHEWVSQPMIPAYYSLGHVTLATGSYVETFGNVPYESLACGTPAIVSRVGPARELLPDHLIDKVDPGDIQQTAAIAARIIANGERTRPETLAYLRQHFQRDAMVTAYADVILNAQKRPMMPYLHRPIDANTRFKVAPWVYLTAGRAYHDLHGSYTTDEKVLARLYEADTTGETTLPQTEQQLYIDGWLVPVQT